MRYNTFTLPEVTNKEIDNCMKENKLGVGLTDKKEIQKARVKAHLILIKDKLKKEKE